MSKAKKRFLIITPATLLVLCLSLYFAGNHMLSYAMSPVQPELAPDSPLYDQSKEKREYENEIDEIANKQMDKDDLWLKSVSTVMSIQSFDNLKLNAYVAKHGMNSPFSQTHNWAIFMHGYRDNPSRMSPYAHHFFDKGFNVVIPGQRGHGWSEGDCVDMGYYASIDVTTWVSKILSQDKEAKILLYGVSMGAATVMMSTGHDLPDNVVCAIEDCGYSSVWDQFSFQLKEQFSLPEFPMLYIASALCKSKYGFKFKEASPTESVSRSKTPTLFIHGSADTYVPFAMLDKVYNAASCKKEKVVIEGATHARSAWTDPNKYWSCVDQFAESYFLSSDSTAQAASSM